MENTPKLKSTQYLKKKTDYTEKDCRYWLEIKGPQKIVENWSTILKRLLNINHKFCYWTLK